MAITKKLIDELIITIQNLYLADDVPWMVGYSGGKDSTAAVQLVWMALEKLPKKDRKKPIHIMNTDTLVESPVVSKWVEKSLDSMRVEAEKRDLPIIPERLIPDYNNTFWVNLIGRGYPFPRMKYRWCTDRLKIQPVNNFIKNKIAEHGEIILVLGTRKQESSRRNRTMTNLEKKRVRELLSPNPTLANELVFSPMEDWTDDDVWAFLMQYKNPWNYSNKDLLTMYRGATADNECPLQIDKSTQSCGKSRFGCWVCTMVEKDKSTQSCGKLVDEIRSIKYNMLSFSAHKLMGPQGVGVLVLRKKKYKLPPVRNIMYGGQQEHGIRPGTIPVALVAGCGMACEIANKEYKDNAKKAVEIKKAMLQELNASGIEYSINGDPEFCVDTTINVSLKGVSSEALMISTKQFCGVSNGSASTSKSYSPSYVLRAMGIENDTIESSLRISWGAGTNKNEAIEGIRELLLVAKQFNS